MQKAGAQTYPMPSNIDGLNDHNGMCWVAGVDLAYLIDLAWKKQGI